MLEGWIISMPEIKCPNCKEAINPCACMRNVCIDCGEPVGNITFTVCDDCWEKAHPSNVPLQRHCN